MMKDNTNSGFSLIELIIAMTILLVLSGMIFLGSDSARRKETEKYAAALGNEILMARTASMSKAGKWRLGLYLKEKEYYCILESEERHPESQAAYIGRAGQRKSDWGMPARLIMNGCPEAAILTVKGTFQTAPEPERAAWRRGS